MNDQDNPTVELSAHEKAVIEAHFACAGRDVIAVWYWHTNGKKYGGYLRRNAACELSLEVRHLPHFGRRVVAFMDGTVDWGKTVYGDDDERYFPGYFHKTEIRRWSFKREHLRMMKRK